MVRAEGEFSAAEVEPEIIAAKLNGQGEAAHSMR